jgi:hypothetical protein
MSWRSKKEVGKISGMSECEMKENLRKVTIRILSFLAYRNCYL